MSAGARTTTSLYDGEVPTDLRLLRTVTSAAWEEVRARARTAAGRRRSRAARAARATRGVARRLCRGRARRATVRRRSPRTGRGEVERVSLVQPAAVGAAARAAVARAPTFVVAKLLRRARPASGSCASILGARRSQDLVLVIQDPSHITRRLVAAGAAGVRGAAPRCIRTRPAPRASSAPPTSRRPCSSGSASTVPDDMSGEPIEARGDASPADLSELRNRLTDLGPAAGP